MAGHPARGSLRSDPPPAYGRSSLVHGGVGIKRIVEVDEDPEGLC